MAQLYWMPEYEQGPATTQELADIVEAEGVLISDCWVTEAGQRCLWGVIDDYSLASVRSVFTSFQFKRVLVTESRKLLYTYKLSMGDSDSYIGTPQERCQEMVRRFRVIP